MVSSLKNANQANKCTPRSPFVEIAELTKRTDTFALANLFQVLESNMGIIGEPPTSCSE